MANAGLRVDRPVHRPVHRRVHRRVDRYWALALGALAALLMAPLAGLGQASAAERGPPLAAPASPAAAAAAEDPNNARVIVKYRAGSELARLGAQAGRAQHAARMANRLALPMADGRPLGPHIQGLRGTGLSSRQLAARLATQPDVEWAVVDQRRTITALPNDPYFGPDQTSITPTVGQWYLRTPDSTIISAINAPAAWDVTHGAASITVAVLDTGVRFDHPDLAGKLWPGYDFVRATSSNDGDGRDADASDPGDWSTAADTCGASNSSWHGTQVAGLIGAATDNNLGMASIGRNVMVLPVRVLGKCGGFDLDIQAAMLWAAGLSTDPTLPPNPHPAQVINLSLGGAGSCTVAYQSALAQLAAANVTVVVAAGNTTGLEVNSPANCSGVIAVAGVRHAGTKVGYSSLGPQVALAAPAGNCINERGACLYPLLTTVNSGSTAPGANTYSSSAAPSLGTSFASPLVAGTVGLMLSANTALTVTQIKSILQATARRFPMIGAQANNAPECTAPGMLEQVECYCTTSTCGAGMLDAGAAVSMAAGRSPPPVAVFALTAASPTVGTSVTLDGTSSSSNAVAYQWAVTNDVGSAVFSGLTNLSQATLLIGAKGTVQASLTVTDIAGNSSRTSHVLMATAAPTAVLGASTAAPTVGGPIVLEGQNSIASTGRTVVQYEWAIVAPSAAASFTSATNASRAVVVPGATGSVTVMLTVTDGAGDSRSAQQTFQVLAAPVAHIEISSSEPTAGSAVTLDGRSSEVAGGHKIIGYLWTVTSGAGLARFNGDASGSTAVLSTTGAGLVVVSLAVTDDAGSISTATQSFTVSAAPVVVTPPSSGGGAMGAGWLLGLATAVALLARRKRVAA